MTTQTKSRKRLFCHLLLLALCCALFWLPLSSIVHLPTNETWIAATLAIQWAFVISCYILCRDRFGAAVIIVEVLCMLYNIASCYAPDGLRDTICHLRPIFVHVAFIIQLAIIAISMARGGGGGSEYGYHRRKSDPVDGIRSINDFAQYLFGRKIDLEAQK
jgi:hypothetical protein